MNKLKLEVKFGPKLHLCHSRDLEYSFWLLWCCPPHHNHTEKNRERNVLLQLELSGNSVAMERIRAESISFMLLMNTEEKFSLSLS